MTDQKIAAPTPVGAAPARVLGLDLSLRSTGVACPDGTTGRILTRPADGDRRLTVIREAVQSAVGLYVPHLAVLEDLPTHAHSAGITGMVHGVVRAALADASVPVALVAPATLKAYATGHGNATKTDMREAAATAAGRPFDGDDEADAWWLRAAGLDWLGQPVVTVTEVQRARLDKAKWPKQEAAAF